MAQRASYSVSHYCHLCGGRLIGRYVRYETGLTVCESCEASRPHCSGCRLPLSDAALAARRPDEPLLCADCARAVPRCACCGHGILGVFYTFEELLPAGEERRFCASCVQHRPKCDLCAAPVAEGAAPLSDGQWRCAHCAHDLVLDDRAVHAIYAETLRAFGQVTGSTLPATPGLEVVSRTQMGAIRRRYGHEARGTRPDAAPGYHVLGYFVRRGPETSIYVERALPRGVLLGTLAHELGHAWQTERAPALRDQLLTEGFAEWLAHRVLVATGLQTAAARATRRDDLYGRGLRHFLDVERTHGRAAVLAAIAGTTP